MPLNKETKSSKSWIDICSICTKIIRLQKTKAIEALSYREVFILINIFITITFFFSFVIIVTQ